LTDLNFNISGSFISVHSLSSFPTSRAGGFWLTITEQEQNSNVLLLLLLFNSASYFLFYAVSLYNKGRVDSRTTNSAGNVLCACVVLLCIKSKRIFIVSSAISSTGCRIVVIDGV